MPSSTPRSTTSSRATIATRRALLGALAAGSVTSLAGCAAPLGARQQPNDDSLLRRVTVADRDAIPTVADVDLEVTMLEPTVTTEHTARLRVAFTNAAAGPREFTFGSGPPFTRFWSLEPADGPELLLLPVDADHEKVAPDCWRPDTDVVLVARGVQRRLTLAPGETLDVERALWDSNRNEGDDFLVPGRYRFENGYGLPDGTTFDWGFTLAVERA